MAKVSLFAKFTAKEGKADELIAAFDDMFAQVETEPGTELYVLNRSGSDSNVFYFYELYTDGDALGAHGSSEAMAKAMGSFGALMADTEMVIGEPLKAKGVSL